MKVYSFSLFGDRSSYFMKFIPSIVRAFYCLYDMQSGWNIKIYHDSISMQQKEYKILKRLSDRGLVILSHVPQSYPLGKSALMRMMSIWDESIDLSVFRDLDYLPTYRERQMMEVFYRSDAIFHTSSDHECHLCPLMAGMIAAKNKELVSHLGINSWEDFVSKESETFFKDYGGDQEYLVKHYWERLKPITCEHRLSGIKVSNCLHSYTNIDDIDLLINKDVKEHSNTFGCCIGGYTSDSERQRATNMYQEKLPTYIKELILEAESDNE